MIIIDSREPADNKLKLKMLQDVEVKEEFLEVGDYLLPDDYAIERKHGRDFMASVVSNRLYKQLNNLYQYENPVLAIIVDNKWRDFYFTHSKYVHKQYMGVLTTLMAKYPKLRIIQLETEEEFRDFLHRLHNKLVEDGHKERPTIKLRKARNIKEVKENCLAQIDGVGVSMAKKLIHEFGTINNISNCSEKDLTSIEKLGKKTAEKIIQTLN